MEIRHIGDNSKIMHPNTYCNNVFKHLAYTALHSAASSANLY